MLDFEPHWNDYLCLYEFFDPDTGKRLVQVINVAGQV